MKPIGSMIIKPYVFLTLSMLVFNTIQSQTKIDTLLASQYYRKADSLLTYSKLDSSIFYFKKALPLYTKTKTWEKVANCYNKIAENQWRAYKSSESLKNSEKSLEINNTYLTEFNGSKADTFDNIGFYYKNNSQYDQSLQYFQKALTIREKIFPKAHFSIAESYRKLGGVYSNITDYDKALQYSKKALEIYLTTVGSDHKSTGIIHNQIGIIYSKLGDHPTSLHYYQKKIPIDKINNNIGAEYTHVNMAVAYSALGQYEKCLDHLQKAIPYLLENGDVNGLQITYNNMGVVLMDITKRNEALSYFKKSLNMNIQLFGEDHISSASTYSNLGIIYYDLGNLEKSLQYYKKALHINRAAYGENHTNISKIYNNLGSFYIFKKDYTSALENIKKALAIRINLFGKNHAEIAESYAFMGDLFCETEAYDDALKYYKKGISIMSGIYGEKHTALSQYYLNVTRVYNKQKEYSSVIDYYDKALLSNTKNDLAIDAQNYVNPTNYYNHVILLEILTGKAKALRLRYEQNKIKTDLDQSISLYKNADFLINSIRQSYQNYQDKVDFAKLAKGTYKDAIAAHLIVYKNTQKQEALTKAFYYAEKSKANTLKELLSNAGNKEVMGISPEILQTEKDLKKNRAFYQTQILSEQSSTPIDSLKIRRYESELFSINQKQDSLLQVLKKDYPKYYQLTQKNDIASVKYIQKNLSQQTTLLEFFTSDSSTYAFTISKNNFTVKEIPTSKLTEKIKALRTAIISQNTQTFKTVSQTLYQQLINPIKDQMIGNELIIVPDGSLWHLNFDLLLTQNDTSNNPKNLSYLIRDYAITYANSATLLFDPFKNEAPLKKLSECLAFSFSDSTNIANASSMSLATLRADGDDLPGTRKEINAIANIIDGQYYYGSEAGEANFKKNASNYSILHLALHGKVDNERPQNSKLFFTKSTDTIEDDYLYAHELLSLEIPAELAVLSACNTGSGKIAKGEGIMSLGNAFQYAGTKSLLLSSWEVSDKTTPILMQNFYSNLRDGMNKAKALQQAKLQYLQTANIYSTHPFYWGGFYLVGDTTPISFENNTWLYWYLGLGILGSIFFGTYLYRRRKKMMS